jgi:putative colanic acid biosysnthesis UDP-glucose lipid carrier transferase
MNKQFERYLQMSLIALDLIALNFAFVIAKFLVIKGIPYMYFNAYLYYTLLANGAWMILSFFSRTYTGTVILVFESFTKRSIKVYLFWVILLLAYLLLARQLTISRIFIVATVSCFGIGLLLNRFLYLGIRNYHKSKENFVNKVLIVGYNTTSKKLAGYFEEQGLRTKILGFISDKKDILELTPYPILYGVHNTVQLAKDLQADEIYSCITPEQNNAIYEIMNKAEEECIRFKIVPNLSFFINKTVHIDYFRDLPIISLRSQALDDVGNRIKKRALDVTVSFLVIVFVLSWLVPLLGLIIKLQSKGPIFFSQLRTGKNKVSFQCLKFRSMRMNNDSDVKQATKGDDRVTAIGKFMRKTSLDEFPQFINVFKGEMSLVGPRPHMLKHTFDYSKIVDEYMIRQFLKPGITGWAQINGYRGEITNPEQIQMRVNKDLWYLQNWTLWLDVKILFLTVYQTVKGDKNAY